MKRYALGLDYGTNSCRALIVDLANGDELASYVYPYPSGKQGILLDPKDPNVARQNPKDYIEAFDSIKEAIKLARKQRKDFNPHDIVGIGVDTTGSTPLPVDRDGIPLAFNSKFKKNLNAAVNQLVGDVKNAA